MTGPIRPAQRRCPTCLKAERPERPGFDGCSRVECPMRRPRQFDPELAAEFTYLGDGAYAAMPTNKE